jgi:hypothetical protein
VEFFSKTQTFFSLVIQVIIALASGISTCCQECSQLADNTGHFKAYIVLEIDRYMPI